MGANLRIRSKALQSCDWMNLLSNPLSLPHRQQHTQIIGHSSHVTPSPNWSNCTTGQIQSFWSDGTSVIPLYYIIFCHNRPYKLMMFQLVGWHFQCTFEIWSQNVGRPNTSMSSQTMGLWILWILFGIVNQCVTLHSRNGRDSNSSHSLCDSS